MKRAHAGCDLATTIRAFCLSHRLHWQRIMKLRDHNCLYLSVSLLALLVGCSSGEEAVPSASGGAVGMTGGASNTGGAATGGAATGGAATGGAATGGAATGGAATGGAVTGGAATGGATTGGAATGGAATGGVATGGVATGGAATGGVASGGAASGGAATGGEPATGGESSTGGGDGTGGMNGIEAQPSAGCGMSTMGNGNIQDAIVTFPADYDGSTPAPLVFGFHGAGRSNQNFRTVDARTEGHALEDDYIMVYLKSDGDDWLGGSNAGKFDSALGAMLSNNCVDENRIFAIGHSSGAQFITTLLCGGEGRFLATAPVAGGLTGQCNNHPAGHQLYIHGTMDAQRGNGNGSQAAELVIGANMCGGSVPYEQAGCDSSQNGAAVTPGCNEYQDCTHRMVWCGHDDPNYGGDGNNHGWPCFANDAIKTFFDSF